MSGVQFLAHTHWWFLPDPVSTQLCNSPSLLSKNYSWLLTQQQIFGDSHSTEAENMWSLNVMAVQRQFTFCPKTWCEWINKGGHTYKNTTHQDSIMHYLEFIFLNCTAVMPLTLPLTFWCLGKFQFPFTWWWKTDCLMSCCIKCLSIYLLTKKIGILINYRLDCTSHMFLHAHNHQNWIQYVTLTASSSLKLKISKLNGSRNFAFSTTKLKTC